MTLAWRRAKGGGEAALMEIDRVALRRLLLGMLALDSASGSAP